MNPESKLTIITNIWNNSLTKDEFVNDMVYGLDYSEVDAIII
jgi:hypothetical protein